MAQNKHITSTIRVKVLRRFLVRVSINGLAVGLIVFSILYLTSGDLVLSMGFVLIAFAITLIRAYSQKKESLSDGLIARNLDKEFKEMEFSSHLLNKDDSEMNDLEKLQFLKISDSLEQLIDKYQPKVRTRTAFLFLGFSFLVLLTAILFKTLLIDQPKTIDQEDVQTLERRDTTIVALDLPKLDQVRLTIDPPSYTHIRKYSTKLGDLSVVENSRVSFELEFDNSVDKTWVEVNSRQFELKPKGNLKFGVTVPVKRESVYQLKYQSNDTVIFISELHQILVKSDKPPDIEVSGLDSYLILEEAYTDPSFKIELVDDFGLAESYIVATITKGEGESVKFREETIPLDRNFNHGTRKHKVNQKLDLSALGMEAGDELYFYVFSSDNKYPEANLSRSQTYFITIPDLEREMITLSSGIGVDLMPEYFRSQRQIIIDTEKLIAERGLIEKKEFDKRSNNLAYDQKQLRLRYGQFMGEEFATDIGGSSAHVDSESVDEHDHEHDEPGSNESILEEFGHEHDTEDVMDRGVLDVEEDVVEELSHSHDDAENATLFFESSKVKLRAALSLMWTSELHLRLSNPEKALPVEYEILKLLKEVQQMSRIYVQRIGFDPPPIKEFEKRLTGETEGINNNYYASYSAKPAPDYSNTIKLLRLINHNLVASQEQGDNIYSSDLMDGVKQELAETVMADPIKHFELIQLFQLMDGKQSLSTEQLHLLQERLYRVLSNSQSNNGIEMLTETNKLNQLYLEQLSKTKALD